MARQATGSGRPPRAIQRTVRERWAVIVLAAALVLGAAVAASARQAATYEATARVFIGQSVVPGDVGARLLGNYKDPQRAVKTQARLAHTPAVAGRVLARVPAKGGSTRNLLDDTRVYAETGGDVLAFSVEDADPLVAERLATEYARQYTSFRRRLDRLPIEQALSELRAYRLPVTLDKIDNEGQALETLRAIAGNTTTGVEPARSAGKTGPHVLQSGLAGLLLGVLFGLSLAFLWDALDSRIRGSGEVAAELGVPELASVPVDRRLKSDGRPALLAAPESDAADAFRYLGATVSPMLNPGIRTLMVTSALPGEGKSAVAANLSVALARAGWDVAMVDLNLRGPAVASSFGVADGPGLTDVAVGDATLDEALRPIGLGIPDSLSSGALKLLPSGGGHIAIAELLDTRAFARIFDEMRDRSELVVCDTPALIGAGGATPLLSRVDACIVIARLGVLDRSSLAELARISEPPAAPALGFVTVEGKPRPARERRGTGGRVGVAPLGLDPERSW